MTTLLAIALVAIFAYLLPLVHVLRSNRTPPGKQVMWAILIVFFGLFGYFMWFLMTTSRPSEAQLSSPGLPAMPAPPSDGSAILYLMRSGYAGRFMNNDVFLDDQFGRPIASIRGSKCVAVHVTPGHHTLYVKNWMQKFEYPFDVQPGQQLAFSLTLVAGAVTSTLEGWLDEANTRYRLSRQRPAQPA